MIIGFICSHCRKYVSASVCAACLDKPSNKQLNGNVVNHIDTQWATENNGKGHWSHQFQRHFSSRSQLKKHAQRTGNTVIDGPMGCNTGDYKNSYTDAERKAGIRRDRKKALEKAFGF